MSSNDDFYNVIQYGDVLETVGDAVDRHGISPSGSVSVSPTAHKMIADIDFDGTTVYADQDDPIKLGLQVRSGHSGFHGLKYDVGAEREVCSNGMTAFVSELGFEQTHGDPFDPGLAYNAVDAVAESPAEVEHRLAQAQNREFMNQEEALLVLLESGVGRFLDNPVPDLLNGLYEEVDDPDSPSLWETYNAATRVLTHYTDDSVSRHRLADGFESAAQLLENGSNSIPDPEQVGRVAVESRSRQLIERGGAEPYWDGEVETLRELRGLHGLGA
ncbi:DUF932 domain-containing protein [Halobaculum saliterrae]|uniref:DUF932 domain-containing protein n=1 Tax=Halobaculum saliterrae TaxID=2073113 RepID=UPI002AA29D43|nr:DUF932 domain-containing protein [Halobaculum saliterrae]